MRWTDRQAEAIESRGQNLLVAAAAGSGKTAVLVERIKRLSIGEKIPMDNFLVLTFTNAAASEMKEKLIKAIYEELSGKTEDETFLRNQLSIINSANISTFHAFAQEVIRRFFHIIGVNPALKVCDEAQQQILKNKAMDELFESQFEKKNSDFLAFLTAYATAKSEGQVKNMIFDLSSKMESLLEPKKWLLEAVENLNINKDNFESTSLAKWILLSSERKIEKLIYVMDELAMILYDNGLISACELAKHAGVKARETLKYAKNKEFKNTLQNIELIEFPELTQKSLGKEYKEQINAAKEAGAGKFIKKGKDLKKEIISRFNGACEDKAMQEMRSTHEHAKTLARLTLQYYEEYAKLKEEKKLIDFTDIERNAIKILEHEEAAKEYRQKFEYIFIDEYQDSNPVQEKLISLIKRENNLFMVGDVKQSIYKFRQAEPRLFEEKYRAFRDGLGSKFDKKIDLNANFRSKSTVIDSVNHIFKNLMGERYDEDAQLNLGLDYDGEFLYDTQIHVVEDKKIEEAEFDGELKQALDDMEKIEKEAAIVANIVKETLGKKIFDAKKGIERKVELRDIVVLLRNVRGSGEKFKSVFEERGIASYVPDSEGYFDTVEIQILMNLLKVIDNRRQDIPLLSVLCSPIFRFSYEEIAKIRIACMDGTFFDALTSYPRDADVKLSDKIDAALYKIDEWRELSSLLSMEDFIWEIISKSGYYTFICALPNGEQRQANLRALLEKAKEFQQMNIRGLHEFIDYVNMLKARAVKIGQVSMVSENDNVLRIMTIHKSKGLEFPIVIVAGLGKRWKNSTETRGLAFNKDMGIGFEFVDTVLHYRRKTAFQREIIEQNEREALEEEKRILYVAFTRAQDQLILVGTKKIKDEEDEQEGEEKRNETLEKLARLEEKASYLDLIMDATKDSDIQIVSHSYEQIALAEEEAEDKKQSIFETLELAENASFADVDYEMYKKIDESLSFEYPYLNALPIKSKFSVSELNIGGENEQIVIDEPNFGIEKSEKLTKAQLGTAYHTLLEKWDYVSTPKMSEEEIRNYAGELIDDLASKNILLKKEAQACRNFISNVQWFIKTEIGKRMSESHKITREASFVYHKEIEGQMAIVQGTVDCYFEDEKGIVLIDYKTGKHYSESDEELKDRYEKQLRLYREALEIAMKKPVSEAYLIFIEDRKIVKC